MYIDIHVLVINVANERKRKIANGHGETERKREQAKKKWIIKSRARDWKIRQANPITWRMTSKFHDYNLFLSHYWYKYNTHMNSTIAAKWSFITSIQTSHGFSLSSVFYLGFFLCAVHSDLFITNYSPTALNM